MSLFDPRRSIKDEGKSMSVLTRGNFSFSMKKFNSNRELGSKVNLQISDGIGFANAIMPKEILDELSLYSNQIKEKCILIIRGRLIRYSCEDGKTAFIF
jgi:hypothetical protein